MSSKITNLGHLRSALLKAKGVIAQVAQAAADAIEEVAAVKVDKVSAVPVAINTAGWSAGTLGPYEFYYDIPVAGLTAKDRADITIAPAGVETATACGLCPTTETLAGKIRLRAIAKPTASIAAEYWLTGGKE